MDNSTNEFVGRDFQLCLGQTPILTGVIENYESGAFMVRVLATDTATNKTKPAVFTINPDDPNVIFTMTVEDDKEG